MLNYLLPNIWRTNNKVKCYLSSSEADNDCIKELASQLDSKFYSFVFNDQQPDIKNSVILIAYVTAEYLKCKRALDEFNQAMDHNMKIFCLLHPDIEITALTVQGSQTDAAKHVLNDILAMKAFHNMKLAHGSYLYGKWSEDVVSTINKRIAEIINEQLNKTEMTLNLPSIEDFNTLTIVPNNKVKDPMLNYRSTIIDDNLIAIISQDIKSSRYYICLYNSDTTLKTKEIDAQSLCIEAPSLITTNKSSQVLITDDANGKLLIFDKNFKALTNNDACLQGSSDMTVDEDTNDIYLVKYDGNPHLRVISNHSTKRHQYNMNDFRPRFIKVANNQIYIVNACSLRFESEKRIPHFGESSIYIFDKNSYDEPKFKINFNDHQMCQPWTLIIDNNLNIYTTVFKMTEKKSRYLCKLNKERCVEECLPLDRNLLANDIFYLKKRFLVIEESEINVYSTLKTENLFEEDLDKENVLVYTLNDYIC